MAHKKGQGSSRNGRDSNSQRLGVKLQELCDWNGIKNPGRHKLQVGRELVVRPSSTRPAVRAGVAG